MLPSQLRNGAIYMSSQLTRSTGSCVSRKDMSPTANQAELPCVKHSFSNKVRILASTLAPHLRVPGGSKRRPRNVHMKHRLSVGQVYQTALSGRLVLLDRWAGLRQTSRSSVRKSCRCVHKCP